MTFLALDTDILLYRSTSAAERTYTALEVQVDRIWFLTDFTP